MIPPQIALLRQAHPAGPDPKVYHRRMSGQLEPKVDPKELSALRASEREKTSILEGIQKVLIEYVAPDMRLR
jgi:hypothetical protein